MTVNDAVGSRCAAPRRWDEGDYSHFAVLQCASRPVMPLADHSPLTERLGERLLVADREILPDAVMELRCP